MNRVVRASGNRDGMRRVLACAALALAAAANAGQAQDGYYDDSWVAGGRRIGGRGLGAFAADVSDSFAPAISVGNGGIMVAGTGSAEGDCPLRHFENTAGPDLHRRLSVGKVVVKLR